MARFDIPNASKAVQLPSAEHFAKTGIYFLFHEGQLVYVGKAVNMRARIGQHMVEGCKQFDSVCCRPCHINELTSLERRYIARHAPKYNNCIVAKRSRKEAELAGRWTPPSFNEVHGLTAEQFDWLTKQPDGPQKGRIPRAGVRRYIRKKLDTWAASHQEMIDAAKLI